jgi:hypothetical protein
VWATGRFAICRGPGPGDPRAPRGRPRPAAPVGSLARARPGRCPRTQRIPASTLPYHAQRTRIRRPCTPCEPLAARFRGTGRPGPSSPHSRRRPIQRSRPHTRAGPKRATVRNFGQVAKSVMRPYIDPIASAIERSNYPSLHSRSCQCDCCNKYCLPLLPMGGKRMTFAVRPASNSGQ